MSFSSHILLRYLKLSRNLLILKKGFLSKMHVPYRVLTTFLHHILEDGEGIGSNLSPSVHPSITLSLPSMFYF